MSKLLYYLVVLSCFLVTAWQQVRAETERYTTPNRINLFVEFTEDPNVLVIREDWEDARTLLFVHRAGVDAAGIFYCEQTKTSVVLDDWQISLKNDRGEIYYQGVRVGMPTFKPYLQNYYRLDDGQGVIVSKARDDIYYISLQRDNSPTVYLACYAADEGVESYGFSNAFHVVLDNGEMTLWRGTNLFRRGSRHPPPQALPPNTNPCPPLAVRPLLTNATPLSTELWEKMACNLYRRHLLTEGYWRDGDRSPAWDDDAVRLIEGFIGLYVNPWKGMKNNEKRLKLCKSLFDRGCQDPYVRFVYGMGLIMDNRSKDARQVFNDLLPFFSSPERPHAFMQFLMLYAGARYGSSEQILTAMEAVLKAAKDGSFQGQEWRRLLFYFTDYTYFVSNYMCRQHETELIRIVDSCSDLDPWFRETLLGFLYLYRAWNRTQELAFYDPSRIDIWVHYPEDLETARQHLEQAVKLNPDYPEPYRFLIRLARLAPTCNQEEVRYWFDRATACQFDFMPAYEELIDAYRTANGGSVQLLFTLGLAFAQTKRYDTAVPDYLYRTLEEIGVNSGNLHELLDTPEAADALMDTAVTYADLDVFRTRNLTRAVVACWFYGDYLGAGKYLAKLPPRTQLNRRTLETFHTSENEIIADIRIHTGRPTGRLHEEQATATMLSHRRFLTLLEKRLATGEWTPLMREGSLDGWNLRYGSVDADTNQQQKALNTSSDFQLRGQMDMGDAYELAMDFELVTPTNYVSWGAGLGTYNSPPPFGGAGLCKVELNAAYYPAISNTFMPPGMSAAQLGVPGAGAVVFKGPEYLFPTLGRNTLLLRANGNRAEVYLNGKRIRRFQYRVNPGQNVYPYLFSPPTYVSHAPGIVRYGNVRARRLEPGTRLESLPPPGIIPCPVWDISESSDNAQAPDDVKPSSRAVSAPSQPPSRVPSEPAEWSASVRYTQDPVWIKIVPPDNVNTNWRVIWESEQPLNAMTPPTPYTVMYTTNLMQPFEPLIYGVTNNQAAIPVDPSSGFFYVTPTTNGP